MQAQKFFSSSTLVLEELSQNEVVMAKLGYAWKGVMLQNNYYLYTVGLFDKRYWPQQERRISGWYNDCQFRQPLDNFIDEFQEYLLTIQDKCVDQEQRKMN